MARLKIPCKNLDALKEHISRFCDAKHIDSLEESDSKVIAANRFAKI